MLASRDAATGIKESMELIDDYKDLSPKIVEDLTLMLKNMDLQYSRLLYFKDNAEKSAVPANFSTIILEQCEKCEELVRPIKPKLQEFLPAAKNQDLDAMLELRMMAKEFESSILSETQVTDFLNKNGSLVRAINLYRNLREMGVFIVDQDTFAQVKKQRRVVALFFSVNAPDVNVYQKTVDLFLQMTKDSSILVVAINVDDYPHILEEEKIDGPNKIAVIQHGVYDFYDFLAERMKVATLNFAVPMQQHRGDFKKKTAAFVDTVYAVFPCPGINCCNTEKVKWTCKICCTRLEYDLNENFYCNCGSMPIQNYTFRCCQPKHGSDDVHFQNIIRGNLALLRKYKQRNILILGETGVGKSTCINSTACYTRYPTLQEAKANDLLYLIPFELNVVVNGQFRNIQHGTSQNEHYKNGSSCTQDPAAHYFKMEDGYIICIIDTPGIGDSRGIEQDKINMQNIMDYLKGFTELHLVCILMEPNKGKLTPSFQFCFKELVVQFHRSILDNLVFCFTKGSLTRYKIEDTRVPLTVLLNEINARLQKSLRIEEGVNAFIVDNTAYRYLAKIKDTALDYRDLDEDKECANHYIRSSSQIQMMIEKALNIKPHMVEQSQQVNLARNTIINLSGPISKLNEAVNRTMADIGEVQKNLDTCNMSEEKLLKELKKPIKLYKFRLVIETTITCKSCSVLKEVTGDERKKYIEADPSMANMDPMQVWIGTTLQPDANGAFKCEKHGNNFEQVQCEKTFYTDEYIEMEIDPTVQQQLNNAKSQSEKITIMIKNRKKLLAELKNEQETISGAAAQFAVFLQHNTVIPYNDTTEAYLKLCIEMEERHGKPNKKMVLKRLRELLKDYKEEKDFIEIQIKRGSKAHMNSISPAEVLKTVEELKQLKNYGEQLRDSLEKVLKPSVTKQQKELSTFSAGENPSKLRKVYNYVSSFFL